MLAPRGLEWKMRVPRIVKLVAFLPARLIWIISNKIYIVY